MMVILGAITVIFCVFGGFVIAEGKLLALWQPAEILIICGAALGSFLTANTFKVVKTCLKRTCLLLVGGRFDKKFFLSLLSLLFGIATKVRKSGLLSIEDDIESPKQSDLFRRCGAIRRDKRILNFLVDNLRLIIAGQLNPHEFHELLENEIEVVTEDLTQPVKALANVSDALPGFGIVAAVLGIVITMQFIGGDPKILGIKVAAALVGTFMGVLLAYGFVGPLAVRLGRQINEEIKCYYCIKIFLLSFTTGASPKLAAEYARRVLPLNAKPSYNELETFLRRRRGDGE